jgi:hypothetical protein
MPFAEYTFGAGRHRIDRTIPQLPDHPRSLSTMAFVPFISDARSFYSPRPARATTNHGNSGPGRQVTTAATNHGNR